MCIIYIKLSFEPYKGGEFMGNDNPVQTSKNSLSNAFFLLALIPLLIAIIAGYSFIDDYYDTVDELQYYKTTYLHVQGTTEINNQIVNYHLFSPDGGQNWYAAQEMGNEAIKIMGTVDEVYPKLIAHLTIKANLTSNKDIP